MKISKVRANNRKRVFEVATRSRTYDFPYAKTSPSPSSDDAVARAYVDKELDREAFTYELASGAEGTIHIEQVLDYHRDPRYLRDLLVYQLTLEAQRRADASPLSKREIIRRLGTSPAQFYRLLDQTNYKKSLDQLTTLLHVLDCDVQLVVNDEKKPASVQ